MSNTSTDQDLSVPMRRAPGRRAERVDALMAAALDELREHGYEGLTVRRAARRGGMAPATAYLYVASKEHLVAELFWRRLRTLPTSSSVSRSAVVRVNATVAELGALVAAEPELASAATSALLGNLPEVVAISKRIGVYLRQRLVDALGRDGDDVTVAALELIIGGALLQAGMGSYPHGELGDRLADVVTRVLRGPR
jgi:AcrR family transcriptional regulator